MQKHLITHRGYTERDVKLKPGWIDFNTELKSAYPSDNALKEDKYNCSENLSVLCISYKFLIVVIFAGVINNEC